MKLPKLTILSLLVFSSIAVSSSAQLNTPDVSYNLIAARNGNQKVYKPGSRLFLKYSTDSLVKHFRGIFAGVTDGKIVMAVRKEKVNIMLTPGDILSSRKIKPGRRILFGGIGAFLVVGGAAVIDKAGSGPGSAIGIALIIPFIGVGSYFLLAVPVSLLVEKLNEKKINKGWKFTIERG